MINREHISDYDRAIYNEKYKIFPADIKSTNEKKSLKIHL